MVGAKRYPSIRIRGKRWVSLRSTHPTYRAPELLAVAVTPLPGLAAEMAGGDHFLQQRRGTVFRVVEAFVKDFHDRQHGVETDHVRQRQRADRMVAAELH